MRVNWNRGNPRYRLWFDVKAFGWWLVVIWRRNCRPFAYVSDDATPPGFGRPEVRGRFLFGRYSE